MISLNNHRQRKWTMSLQYECGFYAHRGMCPPMLFTVGWILVLEIDPEMLMEANGVILHWSSRIHGWSSTFVILCLASFLSLSQKMSGQAHLLPTLFFLFEIHPAATLGSTVFTTMDNEDVQGDEAAPPSSRPVLLARGSHHHAKLVQVWWSHTVSPASSCAAAAAAAQGRPWGGADGATAPDLQKLGASKNTMQRDIKSQAIFMFIS